MCIFVWQQQKGGGLEALLGQLKEKESVKEEARAKEAKAAAIAAAATAERYASTIKGLGLEPTYDLGRSMTHLRDYLEREATQHRRYPPSRVYVEPPTVDGELELERALNFTVKAPALPGTPNHHPDVLMYEMSSIHTNPIEQMHDDGKERFRRLRSDLKEACRPLDKRRNTELLQKTAEPERLGRRRGGMAPVP